jgi:nitroreductase
VEFQQVVDRRRMVRNFAERPVDPVVRDRILTNGLHAPSAGFSQGWAFLVLETPADRALFWESAGAAVETSNAWLDGLRRAPLVVVPMSHKGGYLDRYAEADKGWTDRDEARWPVPYWDIDTGMASLLMLLTVVDAGLGACFFGLPPEHIASFRSAFEVPISHQPIGAIAIGHRAEDLRSPSLQRGRRGVAEVVHAGRWGRPLPS